MKYTFSCYSSAIIGFLLCLSCYGQAPNYGVFGGSNPGTNTGDTKDKWVKFAEITLNGNNSRGGFTLDLFPENANHGDSRQTIIANFRNSSSNLAYSDLVMITLWGDKKTASDVKAVHVSGSGVSNNVIAIWIKLGVSWLASKPFEIRTYGNVTYQSTNQPYFSSIQDQGTIYDLESSWGMYNDVFKINGKLSAEEVKVEVSNGPDYVFDEGYDLLSLESIATYIQKYKHLPEVPSAAEMEIAGIDLGVMNMLLLKKVEELTLYQIQLLKTVKAQGERIKNLEDSND